MLTACQNNVNCIARRTRLGLKGRSANNLTGAPLARLRWEETFDDRVAPNMSVSNMCTIGEAAEPPAQNSMAAVIGDWICGSAEALPLSTEDSHGWGERSGIQRHCEERRGNLLNGVHPIGGDLHLRLKGLATRPHGLIRDSVLPEA